MPEPTSSSAAGAGIAWKLIGGAAGVAGISAALAAAVVMLMTPPRNPREWAVALISTVLSSIGGGAAFIIKFNLLLLVTHTSSDAELIVALMGLLGLVFCCGLPGWAIVRWCFNWIIKRENKDLGEVVQDAAGQVRDVFGGRP